MLVQPLFVFKDLSTLLLLHVLIKKRKKRIPILCMVCLSTQYVPNSYMYHSVSEGQTIEDLQESYANPRRTQEFPYLSRILPMS